MGFQQLDFLVGDIIDSYTHICCPAILWRETFLVAFRLLLWMMYAFRKDKRKVSHSLIAIGAVGVRVPLYVGHSWWKVEPIPLLSLPYPSLMRKRYPFTAGLTEFSSRRMARPSLELMRYGNFLHHSCSNHSTTAPLQEGLCCLKEECVLKRRIFFPWRVDHYRQGRLK